ncbi:MAG: alpha/beta hydrolase [Burkholderiaceae bacterium]|jgi:acetyl esterase/lipase
MLRFALVFTAVFGLSGCSSLDMVNAFTPSPNGLPVTLSYGSSERQRVDVYQAGRRKPLVIFFYGGSWNSGSRTDYRFVARAFNDLGYSVAIPDYRLTPEALYPDFLKDSAQAISLLINRAEEFGADPQRVILVGHSAGAYNAMMVALDQRWLSPEDRQRIRGVIGLASPVNFLPIQLPAARLAFHWPNTPRDSQPIEHVSSSSPPILFINANNDPLVDPRINSIAMAEKLRAANVYVEVENFDGPLGMINHARLVATLSPTFQFLSPTLDKSRVFIERVTR